MEECRPGGPVEKNKKTKQKKLMELPYRMNSKSSCHITVKLVFEVSQMNR